jgi:L-aminopeptidase/D-esterase-like protein
MPLTVDHVIAALEQAESGTVAEGSVGGGTGMVCYLFKCGIGTSSRIIRYGENVSFTVGVLVQANHGRREQLSIAGIPVGRTIRDLLPTRAADTPEDTTDGSIVVVIATDAPLLPGQLERLARRATIGLARTGGQGDSGSGDIFITFSTANTVSLGSLEPLRFDSIPNESLDPLFDGVVQATEEAILNALIAGKDTRGRGGSFVYGVPPDRVRDVLAYHNRLEAMDGETR